MPLRIEVGPRDIASDSLFVARRDNAQKRAIPRREFVENIASTLQDIQDSLFARAKRYRDENTVAITSKDEFYSYFSREGEGSFKSGFAVADYNASPEVEDMLAKDLKVTVRCIPLSGGKPEGRCIFTGEAAKCRAVFAKSY